MSSHFVTGLFSKLSNHSKKKYSIILKYVQLFSTIISNHFEQFMVITKKSSHFQKYSNNLLSFPPIFKSVFAFWKLPYSYFGKCLVIFKIIQLFCTTDATLNFLKQCQVVLKRTIYFKNYPFILFTADWVGTPLFSSSKYSFELFCMNYLSIIITFFCCVK